MSNWLWSFEKLKKICNFKKPGPEILSWAVNRLCWLYPDRAGDTAIKFIDNDDIHLADEVMDFFKAHCDPRCLNQMHRVYKKSSGIVVERIAAILAWTGDLRLIELFTAKYGDSYKQDILGYSLSLALLTALDTGTDKIKEIVKKALERLEEDTPENISKVGRAVFMANVNIGTPILELLEFCQRHPHLHPAFIDLLIIIGGYCGEEYVEVDLEKSGGGDIEQSEDQDELPFLIEETLDYLGDMEKQGFEKMGKHLLRLFEKEKYEEVVEEIYRQVNRLLEEKKKTHGEENFSKWLQGKGMPRQHIETITAFHTVIPTVPASDKLPIAAAALYIFTGLIELESVVGRPVKEMDVDTAIEYFLEDRANVEEDDEAVKILKAAGQEEQKKIITTFLENLWEHPACGANERIVRYLCENGGPRVMEQLFEVDGTREELWDVIIDALLKLGTNALTMVSPILEGADGDDGRIAHVLHVLREIPTDESVEMILRCWEKLWRIDKDALLQSVYMLGDQRLIKPLKNDLKEDEYNEGEVYSFICRLNGVQDPLLKQIEQNRKKWEKKIKKKLDLLEKKDYPGFFREPVIASLTCRRCGRGYHYELYDIMVIPATEDIIINDVVICKHCGAVDHYEIGRGLRSSLFPQLLALMQIKDINPEEMDDFTVVPGEVRLIAGKKMTARESVEYYEDKLNRHPTDPGYIIGLANALRLAKRSEDAEPFYKLALQHDNKAVDAYVSLGHMAQHRNDLKEAYNYYYEAYRILDTGNYYKLYEDKVFFKANLFNNFIEVAIALDKPVPIEVGEWLEEMKERYAIGT
jgi:tetratricopeptide (TPR) repeat protein